MKQIWFVALLGAILLFGCVQQARQTFICPDGAEVLNKSDCSFHGGAATMTPTIQAATAIPTIATTPNPTPTPRPGQQWCGKCNTVRMCEENVFQILPLPAQMESECMPNSPIYYVYTNKSLVTECGGFTDLIPRTEAEKKGCERAEALCSDAKNICPPFAPSSKFPPVEGNLMITNTIYSSNIPVKNISDVKAVTEMYLRDEKENLISYYSRSGYGNISEIRFSYGQIFGEFNGKNYWRAVFVLIPYNYSKLCATYKTSCTYVFRCDNNTFLASDYYCSSSDVHSMDWYVDSEGTLKAACGAAFNSGAEECGKLSRMCEHVSVCRDDDIVIDEDGVIVHMTRLAPYA